MRYKAYMSYCHADQKWAAWLHRSLESYRLPKRLVGTQGLHGAIPKKLSPIFRDRDELSSASDLSVKIKEALADSDALLVVCSPAAAQSKWVNQEIHYFKLLGGKRIYCVIVAGEPGASDPQKCCFPATLLESEDHHLFEPLAADVRRGADGKSLAKLKLVAGLAGVRLDELRQRDKQRKRRRQFVAGLTSVVAIALLVSSFQSRLAERDARLAQEAQHASAESMLAEFLAQSERLEDVADLETRKAFGEVLSNYLARLDLKDLTIESRRQLGVALSHKGMVLRDEGQFEQALVVFKSARDTLKLLVDETHQDEQAMFELSQVEFWIGQVHLDMGRMDEATISFNAYAQISDALHKMQPGNAKWTMEACYAQSNLGNLETRRTPSDPGLVLRHFQLALDLNEEAARLDSKYERELAESHAYLADAWLGVCDLEQAMLHRQKAVELAANHYELNPVSNKLKQDYAYALSGISGVQRKTGELGSAIESLRVALELQSELVEEDPANLNKHWTLLSKTAFHAKYLELSGNKEQSWELSLAVDARMKELLQQDQDLRIDNAIDHAMFLRDFAYRAYRKGELLFADELLTESIQRLTGIAQKHPDNKQALYELALAYFYHWQQNKAEIPTGSASLWLAIIKGASSLRSCFQLDLASRQALMANDQDRARVLVSSLTMNGYHEPEFKRFCYEHGLCLSEDR